MFKCILEKMFVEMQREMMQEKMKYIKYYVRDSETSSI